MTYTRVAAVVVWCLCAATVAAQDRAAEELAALEGGWVVVAAEQRGKPFDAIRGGGLVIEGLQFTLLASRFVFTFRFGSVGFDVLSSGC